MNLLLLLTLLSTPQAASGAAEGKPIPVILDTDLGDDIDDTWALAYLLGSPEVDLRLVVTAANNTPLKTRLTAKILESMGHTQIPIGIGKQTSENPINQGEWLGDYDLAQYPGAVHEDGVGKMIEVIKTSERPVTICVIGPHTNIGAALEREPAIAENARVVSMAGSVYMGYMGNSEPAAEWNVKCDVEAIRKTFAAPWDIAIAPLDTCGALVLSGEGYAKMARSLHPLARTVMENYALWSNRRHHGEAQSSVLFDAQAVWMLLTGSKDLEMKTLPLSVTAEGMTMVDEENGRPVACALTWKDEAPFWQSLVGTLTGAVD